MVIQLGCSYLETPNRGKRRGASDEAGRQNASELAVMNLAEDWRILIGGKEENDDDLVDLITPVILT